MSVQIDTETAALTGEQRLIAAMQEFVNPALYYGADCTVCLIGQVACALGLDPEDPSTPQEVADHFGVFSWIVNAIFGKAARRLYASDFEAAMQMAAEELRIRRPGKEERCRA